MMMMMHCLSKKASFLSTHTRFHQVVQSVVDCTHQIGSYRLPFVLTTMLPWLLLKVLDVAVVETREEKMKKKKKEMKEVEEDQLPSSSFLCWS